MAAYTYLIGWSRLDLWYYGARYAKSADISDLWVSYFTTSKYVKSIRAQHGDPDIIQVRRTFNSADACRQWEHGVLRRMKVVTDPRWINRTDNIAIATDYHDGFLGKNHAPEVVERIRSSKLGKKRPPFTPEWIERLTRRGASNGMFGRTHTPEARAKIGGPMNADRKQKISEKQKAHWTRVRAARDATAPSA